MPAKERGSLPVFPARYREQPKGRAAPPVAASHNFSERAWPTRSSPSGLAEVPFFVRPEKHSGELYEGTALRQSRHGRACLVPLGRVARRLRLTRRIGPAAGRTEGRAAETGR